MEEKGKNRFFNHINLIGVLRFELIIISMNNNIQLKCGNGVMRKWVYAEMGKWANAEMGICLNGEMKKW